MRLLRVNGTAFDRINDSSQTQAHVTCALLAAAMQDEVHAALEGGQEHGQELSRMLHDCFVAFMDAIKSLEAPARNAETKQLVESFNEELSASASEIIVSQILKAMKTVRDRMDLLKVSSCRSVLAEWQLLKLMLHLPSQLRSCTPQVIQLQGCNTVQAMQDLVMRSRLHAGGHCRRPQEPAAHHPVRIRWH
jgi:hypothetical protein